MDNNNETRLREIVAERKRLRHRHPWPWNVCHDAGGVPGLTDAGDRDIDLKSECVLAAIASMYNTDAELAELVGNALAELAALRARCEAAEAAMKAAKGLPEIERQIRYATIDGYDEIAHGFVRERAEVLSQVDSALAALKEAPRA